MTVDDWFMEWFRGHRQRHPRHDWPEFGEAREFYVGWSKLFTLHGVTLEVATEASERMMGNAPEYRSEHPHATLEACREVWQRRSADPTANSGNPRDVAHRLSQTCLDCCGEGLTVRHRRLSKGHPAGDRITLYCRCAMGRYLEQEHRLKAPEIRKMIHDLESHPWLWHDYQAPHEESDEELERRWNKLSALSQRKIREAILKARPWLAEDAAPDKSAFTSAFKTMLKPPTRAKMLHAYCLCELAEPQFTRAEANA